jgi:hypothetical protein
METPFATYNNLPYFILNDINYNDTNYINKINFIKKMEKEIITPIYRINSYKSLPIEHNNIINKNNIIYNPKAGILWIKKKVKFSNYIEKFNYSIELCSNIEIEEED